MVGILFFFQAEDGIRDFCLSRGLGDVYKRQVSRRCPNISKAKRMFNYSPKTTWQEGLAKTIEWYKDFYLNYNKNDLRFFKSPDSLNK